LTSRAAAGRYAKALFDVLLPAGGDLDKAYTQIQQFADLLTAHPSLADVFGNPAIPVTGKRAVVRELLDRVGPMALPVSKLVLLLAERDRLMLLPDIAAAFRDRLLDHQKVIRGEVTTAVPLGADRLQALEQGLGQATGRRVMLQSRVDASIIGGAVTRIGSTVYDGSVTTQLEKMKQALVEGNQ